MGVGVKLFERIVRRVQIMAADKQELILLVMHRHPDKHWFVWGDLRDATGIISSGAIYRALSRLEYSGLVTSGWESPEPEGRPPRRQYWLTREGRYRAAAIHDAASFGSRHPQRVTEGE